MSPKFRFKRNLSICTSGIALTKSQVADIASVLCPADVKACGGDPVTGLNFFLALKRIHSQLIPYNDESTGEEKILFALIYFPFFNDEPVHQLHWTKDGMQKWWNVYGSCSSTKTVEAKSIRYPSWASVPEWMAEELRSGTLCVKDYHRLLEPNSVPLKETETA